MKRLLCIISCMNTGGAETFLMKIYRKLDKTKYQMDFCVNSDENFYAEEIGELGGRIYKIPTKSESISAFSSALTSVIRNNGYDYVIRITSNAMGFMDLKVAKRAGARCTIARSSNSGDADGIKSIVAHKLGKILYNKYVDVKIAPSDLAAIYTFGKKAYESGEAKLLHNAVDLDVYKFSMDARKKIRQELAIDDTTLLVGHVGRFDKQKNHDFLVDVFEKINEKNPDSKLLLVGQGGLMESTRAKIQEKNLSDKVIFAGVRRDVPDILSAFDVFVFPSLYEGMPNTVIEAQACGVPCVISDSITRTAKITDIVEYVSLSSPAEKWADAALNIRSAPEHIDTHKSFYENGYDIDGVVRQFEALVFADK